MTESLSTKPYLIRALHEWCIDSGYTPHIVVQVSPHTRVPMAYVKEGEIVLNINYSAAKGLLIDNDAISFSARFGGVAQEIYIPTGQVKGIFARETGQGMFFDVEDMASAQRLNEENQPSDGGNQSQTEKKLKNNDKKPNLTLVK